MLWAPNQLGLCAHFVRWTFDPASRLLSQAPARLKCHSPRRYVGRVSSIPVISSVLGYRLGK